MGTDYALEIERLSKNLGSFHLKDISLKLPKGYILGYVGQNLSLIHIWSHSGIDLYLFKPAVR